MFGAIGSAVVIIVTKEMAIATLYFLFIFFESYRRPTQSVRGCFGPPDEGANGRDAKGQITDKAQLTLPTRFIANEVPAGETLITFLISFQLHESSISGLSQLRV